MTPATFKILATRPRPTHDLVNSYTCTCNEREKDHLEEAVAIQAANPRELSPDEWNGDTFALTDHTE